MTAAAGVASAPAEPIVTSAAPSQPRPIRLGRFRATIMLPDGWSVRDDGDSATARSPSGKSGFIFFAADDPVTTPRFLQAAESAFGVSMPVGLGTQWTAPRGLRFLRNEKIVSTNEGARATVVVLLGTSPAVAGSSLGLLGSAVQNDGDAETQLRSAIDSIAPQ